MALKCESTLSPDELPRLPLPVGRQRWVLAMRARADASQAELQDAARKVLQAWLPLFPGAPGELSFFDVDAATGDFIAEPPQLELRGPTARLGVAFDWKGPGSEMRWPTLVQRRRERIDPLCPMSPVDFIPVDVLTPEALSGDNAALLPPENPNSDPLDLGLGAIDPGAIKRAFTPTFGKAVVIGGLAIGLLVLSKRWRD